MLSYCPTNVSITDIWVNHGFSLCFLDTFTNLFLLIYILIFGTKKLKEYKEVLSNVYNDNDNGNFGVRNRKFLYKLQVFLHIIIPIIDLIKLVYYLISNQSIYNYEILTLTFAFQYYYYALYILIKECKYKNINETTRGHSSTLLIFWSLVLITENLFLMNIGQNSWWTHLKDENDRNEFFIFIFKYISCLFLFILGLKAPGIRFFTGSYDNLNDSNVLINDRREAPTRNARRPTSAFQKFIKLLPYIWPAKNLLLQIGVVFCFILLMIGRVINLFVPLYSKKIIDSMTIKETTKTTWSYGSYEFRWDLVLIYVIFKFLQGGGTGGMGLLNNARSLLWIKIQQYTSREIEVELFRHIHSLSLRWHLNRKSGEVLRVMDRGTDSIINLLSNILFSILPVLVDIAVAVIYFLSTFNIYFGIIVFTTMTLYITATVLVTEWRTKFQRQMNQLDNETRAQAVDSLLNYETVKYYNNEEYEVESYRGALLKYQRMEFLSQLTLNLLNFVQNIIISIGLLLGSLYCVYLVVKDNPQLTVGDYVLFTSYIIQLYMPLNWFGTYYRTTQRNFIDMENMLDLMDEKPEIIDAPLSKNLMYSKPSEGDIGAKIDFQNVTFSYQPERVVLKNISFSVPGGTTTALVGPSGSGKSTVIRLLFRFYDIDQGSILIDGQNVKSIRQKSLRAQIGVVPQDTVLFNSTIKYNIRYGNLDAPEADTIEAAKMADIHERILNFPQGYETQVGERGLRLSGGEKQRVAIARTFLKAPRIVLLDEATSALDTATERNIQAALQRVCNNRTTIIVAHRLSTICHADEILVLKEGEIVERGGHDDLLSRPNGIYAKMWQDQLNADFSQDNLNSVERPENQENV